MDLTDLIPAPEPIWFQLTDLRGNDMMSEGKPVRLCLHGPDSLAMLTFEYKKTDRQLRLMKQRGNGGDIDITAAELDLQTTEEAITALADWEWSGLVIDGKPAAKFSPEAARAVVSQVRWIRDWIIEKLRKRGNFGRLQMAAATSPEN